MRSLWVNQPFLARLTALCLIMTLPLWGILAFKWPISTDLLHYASNLHAFSAQLWAGELYPRWLQDTNAGFGSPVFLFYSPISFYVMGFFEFLAPVDPNAFGRIFIGLMLSIMVSGYTARRWLQKQLPQEMAESGALLYAGFPYLLLHLYGGFAIGQLWGAALFPLVMEAAEEVAARQWKAVPKFAVAYAALCFAHIPSMLMFAAIPWLYVVVFAPAGRKICGILSITAGCLLGIGLSMIYLLPAVLNKPFVTTNHFLDKNMVYANNFLDTYSLLGIVTVVLPLVALFVEMPGNIRASKLTPQVRFWLVMLAGLFFLTLPVSRPVWEIVTPLQFLQFPFRFFLAMLPGAVFIAIRWLPYVKSKTIYRMLFIVGLVAAPIQSWESAFLAHKAPVLATIENHLVAPEFETRWMEAHNMDFRVHVAGNFKEMPAANVIGGKASASITAEGPRMIRLHAEVASPEATIALRRFYFPGWVADAGLAPFEQGALLAVKVPRGSHEIILTLPWFAGERKGAMISLGAWMVLMGLFAFSRLQEWGNRRITGDSY